MSELYAGVDNHVVNASFTIPTDGDDLAATSVDDAFQQGADNWAHAAAAYPDTWNGGTYPGHGAVTVEGTWTFTPSGSTNMDAAVATGRGTGVALRATASTTGQAINAYGITSAALVTAENDGAGDAISVLTLGNGVGVRSDTSGGAGVPVYAKAPATAGTAAVLLDGGPVQFSSVHANCAAPAGAPGANTLYGANVMKGSCVATCTGGGSSTVVTVNRTFNVAGVVMDASGLFVAITFTTPMADAYYIVAAQYEIGGASTGETFLQYVSNKSTAGFHVAFSFTPGTPFTTTGPQDLRTPAGGVIAITIHGWQ